METRADKSQQVLARNNVKLQGGGAITIVFAHGFGCDQRMWRFVAPAFTGAYRTVLFDHVGSGASDHHAYRRTKYQTLTGYADDLLEIYETLNLVETVYIGHSVSAMIGLLAAIKQPHRFAKLVMLGPSPRYLDDRDYRGGFSRRDIDDLLQTMALNYGAWAQQMATAAMGRPDRPELADELADSFVNADPAIVRHFAEVTFLSDTRAELPKCQTPTLILQCQRDIVVPVEVGEYLARHLPNNRYMLMRATGHFPHLSEPEETIAAIRSFIS